jgi:hypothetical protein
MPSPGPCAVSDRLPAAVEKIEAREGELIKPRQDRDFSIQKLESALRGSIKWKPRPEFH